MSEAGKLIVVTGPSGVGKSTIVREAIARTAAEFSVSVTTRQPREGEVDGQHYSFVDRQQFDQLVDEGKLLEWADVFGEHYGTLTSAVSEAVINGKILVLEIDVQGGLQVHEKMSDAVFVLILPPNDQTLETRLRGRGSETEEVLQRRLAKAKDEIKAAKTSGIYENVIVNDELENAISQLVKIIES